jgi:hypothetical protein
MEEKTAAKYEEMVKELNLMRCVNKSCEQHRKVVTDEQVAWMYSLTEANNIFSFRVLHACCPEFEEVLMKEFNRLKK